MLTEPVVKLKPNPLIPLIADRVPEILPAGFKTRFRVPRDGAGMG